MVGVVAEVEVPLVLVLSCSVSCSVHLGRRPGPARLEPYQ